MKGNTRLLFLCFCTLLASSIMLVCECTQQFAVYTTTSCPSNQSEWIKRSTAINCTKTNGYMCLPNDKLTKLVEFCNTLPRIGITKGLCLSSSDGVRVNWHDCNTFLDGCPDAFYFTDQVFEYPKCVEVADGCFLADPSCVRLSTSIPDITTEGTIQDTPTKKSAKTFGIIIIVVLILIYLILLFGILVYWNRDSSSCSGKEDENVKFTDRRTDGSRPSLWGNNWEIVETH